jgi:hypothetical protein
MSLPSEKPSATQSVPSPLLLLLLVVVVVEEEQDVSYF